MSRFVLVFLLLCQVCFSASASDEMAFVKTFNEAKGVTELNMFNSKAWKKIPIVLRGIIADQKIAHRIYYKTPIRFLPQIRIQSKLGYYTDHNVEDIKIDLNASKALKYCWDLFMSGTDVCNSEMPAPTSEHVNKFGDVDLLAFARHSSIKYGMRKTRDVLIDLFKKADDSKGEIEKRVLKTTANKDFTYKDSFANIPKEERSKVGVYFCLGFGGDDSANAILMRNASKQVSSLGFKSEMLPVHPDLGSDHNAALLVNMMKERAKNVDRIIIVAASKGVADFLTYYLNYGNTLSLEEREKFRLTVSLSGVVRGSSLARYIDHDSKAHAFAVRTWLRVSGQGDQLAGIKTLKHSPFKGHSVKKLKELFPKMTWLSFPVLPEHADGYTYKAQWSGPFKAPTSHTLKILSPNDGMVESAASILPPSTGMTQWIVTAFGAHGLAVGNYGNGSLVAPVSQKGRGIKINPASGKEILDSFFRALPTHILE